MPLSEDQKKELKACILQISATAGINIRGGTPIPLAHLADILEREQTNVERALEELDSEFSWANYGGELFHVTNEKKVLEEAKNLRIDVY